MDPYRTDTDDLGHFRNSLRAALGAITDGVMSLPPSKLERLAKALAYFKGETQEPFEYPLDVLQALSELAPHAPSGLWIDASPLLELSKDGYARHYVGSKLSGELVLPRALRIEEPPCQGAIEFMVTGGDMGLTLISRCPISEYAKMTSLEAPVTSCTYPMVVEFFGSPGEKVRVIVRGDRLPSSSMYPPYPGSYSGACGSGASFTVGPPLLSMCNICHRPKGPGIFGCQCSPRP